MKKWLIGILVVAILAAGAVALKIDTIETPITVHGTYETTVQYRESDLDTHVRIMVPDLDVYSSAGDNSDDSSRKTVRAFVDIPENAPPGEYLVRYVISSDDEKIVKYRWIIVE